MKRSGEVHSRLVCMAVLRRTDRRHIYTA